MDSRMDRRAFVALAGAAAAGLAAGRTVADARDEARPAGVNYTFVVVSDPHLAENRDAEPTGADKFRHALEAIAKLDAVPDFLLMPGDLHVDVLEQLLPEIPLPLHVVAGNHENAEHRRRLRELFPEDFQRRDFYTFEHKGDLFIGMCNAAAIDHVGHFETESNTPPVGQVEWLEAELARRGDHARLFLFGHVPPEPECRPDPMCLAQNDARWLRDQAAQAKPTALFFGHRHQRMEFALGGVPAYGFRSCNWNFRHEPRGFALVTTTAAGCEVTTVDSE